VSEKAWEPIVEQPFAWMSRYRDYEYSTSSSESMVCLIMIRLLVKRLAGAAEALREKPRQVQAA
jgi:hypothetical protein